MSTPVSTPCQHCAGTGGGDRRTYGLSDQATRLLEFHMLYGTNNFIKVNVLSLPHGSVLSLRPGGEHQAAASRSVNLDGAAVTTPTT